jgi:hypothetical protein
MIADATKKKVGPVISQPSTASSPLNAALVAMATKSSVDPSLQTPVLSGGQVTTPNGDVVDVPELPKDSNVGGLPVVKGTVAESEPKPEDLKKPLLDKAADVGAEFKGKIYSDKDMIMLQKGSAPWKADAIQFLQENLVKLGYLQTESKDKPNYIDPNHYRSMDGDVTVTAAHQFQKDFEKVANEAGVEGFKADKSPAQVKIYTQTWSALEACAKVGVENRGISEEAVKAYGDIKIKNVYEISKLRDDDKKVIKPGDLAATIDKAVGKGV